MSGIYAIKPWFLRRLRRFEDALVARRVKPDKLTLAAVLVSLAAGAAIALGGLLGIPALWILVLPLVIVRLALNALDGSVARRTRTGRPFGSALNEMGDRLSDAATVGATSFVAGPKLGLGALACAFLVSFTGVLALAVTGKRDAAGPVGKADRGLLLGAGALIGALLGSAIPFAVVLWAIIAGSAVTVVSRMLRTSRAIHCASRKAYQSFTHNESLIQLPAESVVEEDMTNALVR